MAAGPLDPYAVLGVDRAAAAAEIRAAYLALAARYHPDRHQGNPLGELAAERMAEINQAYELLADPRRRSAFDRARPDGAAAPAAGGAGPRPSMMSRNGKWVLALVLLPVLVRSGAGIVRAFAGLARLLFEALGGLRGTPAAFVLVLLLVAGLVATLLRRRRRRDATRR